MKSTTRIIFVLLIILSVLLVAALYGSPAYAATGPLCYVDADATAGGSTGNSWGDAYTDLQLALADTNCTEIWVAAGTYTPHVSDRAVSFNLTSGVAIYGGFAGAESLLSEREVAANPTILSGDIGTPSDNSDNSYHVVVSSGTANTAVLDGFIITGGNANGSNPNDRGGGIYNDDGSPILANLTIRGNSAGLGGGMANFANGTPILTSVTFSGNAAGRGGGLFNQPGSSSTCADAPDVTIVNSTFSGNSATYGGAIDNEFGGVALLFSTITGNLSGGGVNSWNDSDTCTTVGSTIIAGNTGYDVSAADTPTQRFNSLGYNVIGAAGANVDFAQEFNQASDQVNVSDPKLGSLRDNGGPTQTHALLSGSPALDAGDGVACAAVTVNSLDQRGVSRPQGTTCDSGAFEGYRGTYYAKPGATGAGTCVSWADACRLSTALNLIQSGDEVWVMAGTHLPTTDPANRAASFQLVSGVGVYGGFAGTESLLSQRDPRVNVTILSGDLLGNDSGFANNGENSYHVVVGSGTNSTAILDGFTITGGNANNSGGGIYNFSGSPTLVNLTIAINFASSNGGGIYNIASSPTLTNITINGNSATNNGGGIYNESSTNPALTNVTISGNSATYGGGVYNLGSGPTFTNVTISNNTAAINNGGGVANYFGSTPSFTNVIIANSVSGGDCVRSNSTVNAINTLIEDGLTCVNGTNTANLTGDPKLGALADNGGFTQTHALLPGSSAIDAGDDTACADAGTVNHLDQRGVTRPQGSQCDIGAYESFDTYYVKVDGSGNCSAWAQACALQTALSLANSGSQIWVAAGTHKPTTGTDRAISFNLKSGVEVYGGFAGTESTIGERDPKSNVTIFSGDIGTSADSSDNSYHVVVGSGTDNTAILDGFTITGGTADGTSPNNYGGGIYNSSGNPTIRNVTLSDNSAYAGGAVFNNSSSPTFTNATFSNNSADGGGAMFNTSSYPNIVNATFSGNSATGVGGGIYNDNSHPTLINVTFSGNSASSVMPGPFSDGGGGGGGIFNESGGATFINVVIANSPSGGDCENYYNYPTVNATNSLIEDGLGCINGTNLNNLTGDPNLGSLADNGGPTQTMALLSGSPAIDAGDSTTCAAAPVNGRDQRGVSRPQGTQCDIGAYEAWWTTITAVTPTNAALSWSSVSTGCTYDAFESTTPYFTPAEPSDYTTTDLTQLLAGKLGTAGTSYFYITRATCGGLTTAYSNEVGAFNFAVVPGD